MMTFFENVLAFIPLLSFIQACLIGLMSPDKKHPIAQLATRMSWLTLIFAIGQVVLVFGFGKFEVGPLLFDRLSSVLMVLISLISLIIHHFSVRYMQADHGYKRYFMNIGLLVGLLLLFVSSVNIWLLAAVWTGMSVAMLHLLNHPQSKASWLSAKHALHAFAIGDIAFWIAAIYFEHATGTSSVMQGMQVLAHQPGDWVVCVLLLIAALSKSANIPFIRWLPVTLTAPTPISAIMHAGFVNSGGILLARFSSIFFHCPLLLDVLFLIGLLTTVYGALTMLVQTDIKRSLVFSTTSQMGFMMMQCGLGAFTAALYHLIAHSLFKSYLFLDSGSAIQDKLTAVMPAPVIERKWLPQVFLLKGNLLIFILAALTIGLAALERVQGSAILLWIFPLLTALTLLKGIRIQSAWPGLILWIAVLLPVCYAAFKMTAHILFFPDIRDLIFPLTPFHWVLTVLAIAFLCFATMYLGRGHGRKSPLYPIGFSHRLYVWLLNQNSVFTHRSRIMPPR